MKLDFSPKLVETLKTYNRQKLIADTLSGVTVGIVALPLAIAFGIASGVTPEQGLITAVIGGFIVSLMGGCSVQIAGPTGAFIVIVLGIINQYGIEGLAIATLMAGVILVLLGVFKLGTVIKFIPYPIIVGFTAGIAVTLFTTQIKDLAGLTMSEVPSEFFSKWMAYFRAMPTANPWTIGISIATVLVIVYSQRVIKRIPGSLMAIFLITIIAYAMRNFLGVDSIETIGDRFSLAAELPKPTRLGIDMATINKLLPPAFTIAFLGAVESLLSATVADGITGDKHNSNTELIAQGAANIVSPIFGGIPVTGAIARTMTNINNGGKTPVSGIIHSVVLLLVLLFLGSLTQHIPMACLGGILVVVSYNMSEWRTIRSLMKNPLSDVVVLGITFTLTVVFDLTIAVEIGLLMAMLLFMRRVAETTKISVSKRMIDLSDSGGDEALILPKGVEIYEIEGPFFFGVANKFDESMHVIGDKPKVRIIRMRRVPFMDSTGLHNLESLFRLSTSEKIRLILSDVNIDVYRTMYRAGFTAKIGKENICTDINKALQVAEKIIR